jgi:hypothetical protein
MSVLFLFLLALAVGCLTTLFWISEIDLGRGYFQMNALVVLGLLGLAVTIALAHPIRPFAAAQVLGRTALFGALVASLLYYAAIWQERWSLARWPAALALLGATVALLQAGAQLMATPAPLPHREALLVASLLTSALLLGWSLTAMLLGHWYLIVPRLRFRYLVIFCAVLLGTVLARYLAVGATLLTAMRVEPMIEPHPWRLMVDFGGQGMFFWFRLLWGLGMPLLLALMALHCARRRSNQSATGILYVLVVGSLIGEITALYLTVTTGIPV